MAALRRALLQKSRNAIISFSSTPSPTSSQTLGLRGLRFLSSIAHVRTSQPCMQTRNYSAVRTESSLNDPSPNWSNRPPKETILLDGCDFEHWLIVMEPPQPDVSRDEIIQSYIKTLAQVVGSEDEARMKIYSVSTKHYYAFGALVSEELSFKIKPLPGVRWVLPDSYLDPRTKDYGGEPFINGQAVPYDPKYHEEWVRNNAKCNDRRNNDRPRNFDRSRNFERRREMQQQSRPNVPQRPPPGSPAPNQPQYPSPSPGPGLPPTSPEYPNSSPQQPYSSPPQNPAYGQPQYPAPSQPPRGGYNAGPAPPQGYYNPQQPGGQYSGPPAPPQPGYAPPQPNNNAPPAGQYQDGYYNR